MAPGRPESQTIRALEDAAAYAGRVLDAFSIVMARQRVNMTRADWNEYEQAIEARERLVECLKRIRGEVTR